VVATKISALEQAWRDQRSEMKIEEAAE
jgi:hypothetical protein